MLVWRPKHEDPAGHENGTVVAAGTGIFRVAMMMTITWRCTKYSETT